MKLYAFRNPTDHPKALAYVVAPSQDEATKALSKKLSADVMENTVFVRELALSDFNRPTVLDMTIVPF
jgi:hypothetical protein